MENPFVNLKPSSLWKHFFDLTQIPHPSGCQEEITQFVEDFGKRLGLETLRDSANNICIRKPATPGCETIQPIVLQSHLDMVPQANSDVRIDFEKDPIQPYVDGDWVKAKGTTLGADNGIGAAAMMAILEDKDIQHGPIEALFTTDEETGMFGALAIRPGFINGKILLNLDGEEYGEVYIGCAGGADVTARFQFQNETFVPKEDVAMKVSLTGLKGGHSGVDIHLGRANANKLMFRFLKEAMETYDIRLSSVKGGSLRNAIPREAFAIIIVDSQERYEKVKAMVAGYEQIFREEFDGIEDINALSFKAEFVEIEKDMVLIPRLIQERLTHAIMAAPNNIINMSPQVTTAVQTSINLATIETCDSMAEVRFLARSSSQSKKEALCSSEESLFKLAMADFVETSNGYPGWDPDPNTKIVPAMEKIYKDLEGEDLKIEIIHAGLECGIIMSNVPDLKLDAVSFGPTIKFPHSPDEKVNIPSVEKFWNYLITILKNAPKQN
ncbi:aminoacyl-histidine dipeptidase [Bacteroidales bacterium OttesenSCG-928-M11]|nr:aminoacyl-histidine dipeptidase [Bacteroidales bacterium OttesenSCG-928-M11]